MAVDARAEDRIRLPGARIAACVSRYHSELTGAMLASARRELALSGIDADRMHVISVPGAFELPLVARALARRKDVDAVLCFGLVLKGETEHDRWVAEGCVHGLMQASLETNKPLLLGVLTCATLAQARSRALPPEFGGRQDKGREVARAAVEALAALDKIARAKPFTPRPRARNKPDSSGKTARSRTSETKS